MVHGKSHPAKVWFGAILFFGVGVGIAIAFALHLMDRGETFLGSLVFGATVGGYSAWLVFYLILNALKRCRSYEEPPTANH